MTHEAGAKPTSETPADPNEERHRIQDTWNTWHEEMQRRMHRWRVAMPHELLPHGWHWGMPPWAGGWGYLTGDYPRTDILDRESEIIVRAEIPGVKKEALEASFTEDSITIRLKENATPFAKDDEEKYCHREILRGPFNRTLRLPMRVDPERAEATFVDGLLEVVLPKQQQASRKAIPIK